MRRTRSILLRIPSSAKFGGLLHLWFGFQVGQGRAKYGLEAPAVSGHPTFERLHRVHQNSLENLVIFLPALFLFALFVSDPIAAAVGVVFIEGSAVYSRLYVADPAKRGPGVVLSFPIGLILLIGGAIGAFPE